MDAFCFSREDRTLFVRIVANCNDVIELAPGKLVNRFRTMSGNIDSDLAHRFDRFRPDASWRDAGARNLETIAGHVSQQALCHLASRGVSRAENQHSLPIPTQRVTPTSSGVQHDTCSVSTFVPHSHGAVSARLSS